MLVPRSMEERGRILCSLANLPQLSTTSPISDKMLCSADGVMKQLVRAYICLYSGLHYIHRPMVVILFFHSFIVSYVLHHRKQILMIYIAEDRELLSV